MSLGRSFNKLRWVAFGLAAMHLLPARHHLADFFLSPSLSDAWKGFGATCAVALLALPTRAQARIARALWNHRVAGMLVGLLLAVAHLVPAADHLPKLLASPNYGDAWRGIGASVAIAWFVMPRTLQMAVVRTLGQRHAPPMRASVALAVGLMALLLACTQLR